VAEKKTPQMVTAKYVGPLSAVTVDKLGLVDLPRGEPCEVPLWFQQECETTGNKFWEFSSRRSTKVKPVEEAGETNA
jgi:hypothetical protein